MKKYVSLALVLVLTLSMAGCFGRNNKKPAETMTMPTTNYTTEPTTRATEPSTQPTIPTTHATVPETTAGVGGEDSSNQGGAAQDGTTGKSRGNSEMGRTQGGM